MASFQGALAEEGRRIGRGEGQKSILIAGGKITGLVGRLGFLGFLGGLMGEKGGEAPLSLFLSLFLFSALRRRFPAGFRVPHRVALGSGDDSTDSFCFRAGRVGPVRSASSAL